MAKKVEYTIIDREQVPIAGGNYSFLVGRLNEKNAVKAEFESFSEARRVANSIQGSLRYNRRVKLGLGNVRIKSRIGKLESGLYGLFIWIKK